MYPGRHSLVSFLWVPFLCFIAWTRLSFMMHLFRHLYPSLLPSSPPTPCHIQGYVLSRLPCHDLLGPSSLFILHNRCSISLANELPFLSFGLFLWLVTYWKQTIIVPLTLVIPTYTHPCVDVPLLYNQVAWPHEQWTHSFRFSFRRLLPLN